MAPDAEVGEGPWLLMNFLQHEVLKTAAFCLHRGPLDALGLALNRKSLHCGYGNTIGTQNGYFLFLEKNNIASVG